ncbi:MAG: arginine repressor [Clostridia bacterium]|nr:arginine repressor [Clostridia bacterium]
MKQGRQGTILEIVKEMCIKTQEDLSDELIRRGFDVTQATVSRDIKELRIVKKQTGGGCRYVAPEPDSLKESSGRVHSIFQNAAKSVECASNMMVIKTLAGMADAAAITLESMEWPEILGTIAGDDTVMVVLRDAESAQIVKSRLSEMLH